ncbi:hypothetical protein QYS36_03890 [Pseudomonas sp. G34]|uniref:hypothetical protein n=1 Tax=Pseudomonas sp. G34 TaxID=3059083 RepID=UPI002808C145|nr:hypothetical protein [Pseudomonas sp. G34]MDQ7984078.1 hypothetical protein [Pseudomonas sp. G34]
MDTSHVTEGSLLARLRTRAWEAYKSLQPNQQSYLNAFALFILFLVLKPFDWELKKSFLALAVLFWGMAMISDLLSFYKKTAETLLGKLFYIGSFAFGTNLAIALATQVLNSVTGVDPGQFTHTIAFTSLLVAPPLLLFIAIVALVIGTMFFTVFFMFQTLPDDASRLMMFPWYKGGAQIVRYKGLTALVQMVSLVAVFSFAYSYSQDESTAYGEFVESKTRWFLYNFEMFQKTSCQIEEGQRVAFLRDGNVLVGRMDGDEISFIVRACMPAVGTP